MRTVALNTSVCLTILFREKSLNVGNTGEIERISSELVSFTTHLPAMAPRMALCRFIIIADIVVLLREQFR